MALCCEGWTSSGSGCGCGRRPASAWAAPPRPRTQVRLSVCQCLAVVPRGSEAFVRGADLSAGYSFIWLPSCWVFCISLSCFLFPRLMVSPPSPFFQGRTGCMCKVPECSPYSSFGGWHSRQWRMLHGLGGVLPGTSPIPSSVEKKGLHVVAFGPSTQALQVWQGVTQTFASSTHFN